MKSKTGTRVIQLAIVLIICFNPKIGLTQIYNIMDYGAIGDSKTVNTQSIQKAIDICSQKGGQVLIPKGVFISGTLRLKSKVTINILEGGTLKGSSHFADYPDNKVKYKNAFTHGADGAAYANKAFLFAEGISDISIIGKGTIDGSGDSPEFNLGNDNLTAKSRLRPCMLLLVDCRQIKVTDLLLTNSAYWLQNYLGCDGLELKGLRVFNQTNYNQDAMDIDAKNVLIENCTIDSEDDGICFKSHDRNRPVENVVVRNCTIASNCNAIKFGTMSLGGLKNVSISNCIIHKASVDRIRQWQKSLKFIDQPTTVISGVALEAVDGGVIENVTVSDIQMSDVQTPIFIVLGNRGGKQVGDSTQRIGRIRHILIKNVVATSHSKMTSSITAYPGQYISDVTVENVTINSMGSGTLAEGNLSLNEAPSAYPENRMYGQVFPASGFYIRHVKDLTLKQVNLKTRNPDYRPAIILDDVNGSKLNQLTIQMQASDVAAIRLESSKDIVINQPKLSPAKHRLLQLKGSTKLEDVAVMGYTK